MLAYEIESEAKVLHDTIRQALLRFDADVVVVTVASMNLKPEGQWIIGPEDGDRRETVARLRAAADALEASISEAV